MSSIYEKVRERLDKFPQGFPKTKSGAEMDILKKLFTPEEAEIMLFLRPFLPEPVSTIAERAGRDEKELAEILYRMSKKGLIFRFQSPEQQYFYFLAPWMMGIWEWQLKNLNPENIKLFERFFEEGMVQERKRIRNILLYRKSPVKSPQPPEALKKSGYGEREKCRPCPGAGKIPLPK